MHEITKHSKFDSSLVKCISELIYSVNLEHILIIMHGHNLS